MPPLKAYGFHPDAQLELLEAGYYYAEESPRLSERFHEEMDGLVREICERPGLRRMFDPPARRHFGNTFPYALIYVDEPDMVRIIAVMHFKQRPGYWRHRLG